MTIRANQISSNIVISYVPITLVTQHAITKA